MAKTIAEHRRDGTYRGELAGPEPKGPVAPAFLAGSEEPRVEEIRHWILTELDGMAALASADTIAVDMLSQLLYDYETIRGEIVTEGWTIVGRNGEAVKHPLCSQLNAVVVAAKDLLGKLGLTAKGRTGLASGANGESGNALAAMLKKRQN